MPETREEEVERLRRCVALLAEVVVDLIEASRKHMHVGQFDAPDLPSTLALDRALGKLAALGSSLRVGAGRGGRGKGVRSE